MARLVRISLCNTRANYQTLHGFTYCAVLTASNTPDSGIPYPIVVPHTQEPISSSVVSIPYGMRLLRPHLCHVVPLIYLHIHIVHQIRNIKVFIK